MAILAPFWPFPGPRLHAVQQHERREQAALLRRRVQRRLAPRVRHQGLRLVQQQHVHHRHTARRGGAQQRGLLAVAHLVQEVLRQLRRLVAVLRHAQAGAIREAQAGAA